ncbi:aminopeptidase [Mariprofundus erugo]|uniref:aminopeptidase n=1 Tax=Mariprofundus erugo TaxID=2528639 RepID=UPI001EE7FE72|nr:aminopeptidase [Mariprofundus erugo]
MMQNYRKITLISCLFAIVTMFIGCSTRSISNSGYEERSVFGYKASPDNPFYKGELSEFDVIGIDPAADVTEDDIQKAMSNSASSMELKKGSAIMLIQSGAMIPDSSMVDAMSRYFNVSVFSGVPQTANEGKSHYSRLLRLSAATGGYSKIVCYWGLLEAAQKDLSSKTVSWVPFLGSVIPDEDQQMRIRLKVAVVDVGTGQWEMFSPKAFEDQARSSRNSRGMSDQQQVLLLKEKSYSAAVEALVARYAR